MHSFKLLNTSRISNENKWITKNSQMPNSAPEWKLFPFHRLVKNKVKEIFLKLSLKNVFWYPLAMLVYCTDFQNGWNELHILVSSSTTNATAVTDLSQSDGTGGVWCLSCPEMNLQPKELHNQRWMMHCSSWRPLSRCDSLVCLVTFALFIHAFLLDEAVGFCLFVLGPVLWFQGILPALVSNTFSQQRLGLTRVCRVE